MLVLIFTNCQGRPLIKFLPSHFNVKIFHNYYYINHTQLDTEIESLLSNCDYFIYQPLSTIYPVYNTENMLKYLKNTCKAISFPYIFNDAFTPIYKSIKKDVPSNGEYSLDNPEKIIYVNEELIIELKRDGYNLNDILTKYDNNEINFRYQERFSSSINILIEKEKYTDVKVSQFIIDNHKKYKLFNYHCEDPSVAYCNHPSNVLIIEYVNQIFKIMGLPLIQYEGPELIGIFYFVSKYDLAYYNYEWINEPDECMNIATKKIIEEIYNLY
jgi:hypothetical protein